MIPPNSRKNSIRRLRFQDRRMQKAQEGEEESQVRFQVSEVKLRVLSHE